MFERIQACFRESARRQYESAALPPFTLFFHPGDALVYLNYAIPDTPLETVRADTLARLRSEFTRRGRVARFEIIEEYAPALGPILEKNGFRFDLRGCLMVNTAETVKAPRAVHGLAIDPLFADARDDEVAASVSVSREAFGQEPVDAIGPAEIASHRRFLDKGSTVLLGRMDGKAVGVASLQPTWGGVAEVAGVGTRPAYRHRGIGAALTYAAARMALASGVDTLVIGAGSRDAGRVYESCGFRAVGSTVSYIDAG